MLVGGVVCESLGFEEQLHCFFDGFCSPMVSAKLDIESQSHSNLFDFLYSLHH